MKQIKIVFLCLLLAPMAFMAQESGYSKDVEDYLEHNGTMQQYEFAYGQLLKMLEGQFPKDDTNTEGWAYLEEHGNKALEEIKSLLVPIYQAHFTQDDIKQMVAFYKTEAGVLLMNDRSKMTDAHKEELNSFYNTTVGQKIIGKQEVLTAEISKASENWSRDLYETAMSLLKNG